MNDTVTFVGCREEITLEVGSVAEIQLEAVQGTGYQWLMKDPSLLLEQLWSDVLKYSTGGKENMPGQAGFQVLYFRAVQKGKGEVRLEYKKTFEPTIEKSCVIKVEVK